MAERPNLTQLMESAKKMQDSMQKAKERLSKLEVEGKAGGNLVAVKMNGEYEVQRVTISDEAMNEGKEVLEDLCKAAFNDAKNKVEKASQEEMLKITKDLGLPPDVTGGGAGGF